MCVHQIDLIRSIISKEKAEMQINSQFNYEIKDKKMILSLPTEKSGFATNMYCI